MTELSLSLGHLGLDGDTAEQHGSPIHYWGKLQRMPSKGLFLFKDLFSLLGAGIASPPQLEPGWHGFGARVCLPPPLFAQPFNGYRH